MWLFIECIGYLETNRHGYIFIRLTEIKVLFNTQFNFSMQGLLMDFFKIFKNILCSQSHKSLYLYRLSFTCSNTVTLVIKILLVLFDYQ